MSYDNTNRWTLNKNANKRKDTDCDYTGSINIDGVDCWLNGWVKDGPKGKFISGTVKPKDVTPRQNNYTAPPSARRMQDDDFIP